MFIGGQMGRAVLYQSKCDDHDVSRGRKRDHKRKETSTNVFAKRLLEKESSHELAAVLDLLHGHDGDIGQVGEQIEKTRRQQGRDGHGLERTNWVPDFIQYVVEVVQPSIRVEDLEKRRGNGAKAPIRVFPQVVPAFRGLDLPGFGLVWLEQDDVER